MIEKPLHEIDESHLNLMLENEVFESKSLDYKREIHFVNDGDKKEFLADVCSFANCEGGDLIIGIEEKNGFPYQISGISLSNADTFQQKINNMIRDGIEPHISYNTKCIKLKNGNYVLYIRVQKSLQIPHRVCFQSRLKFFSRNSSGKYMMDMSEVRHAFLNSNSMLKQIEEQREERISHIYQYQYENEGEELKPLILLYMTPMDSIHSPLFYPINQIEESVLKTELRPIHSEGTISGRWNLEGFLVEDKGPNFCYSTQLYRNGSIEMLGQLKINENELGMIISSFHNEQALLSIMRENYMPFIQSMGINSPLFVSISLLNVKGIQMDSSRKCYPYMQDTLILPIQMIQKSTDLKYELKPLFDVLWNAFGLREDYIFDQLH